MDTDNKMPTGSGNSSAGNTDLEIVPRNRTGNAPTNNNFSIAPPLSSGTAVERFRQAIAAAGLPEPETILDDGRIHRFGTNGKARDDSGWYVLYADGLPAGAFGCWRRNLKSTWCAVSSHEMTAAERQEHRRRLCLMRAQRDADERERHLAVAQVAEGKWDQADRAADRHPYLQAKGIESHGARVADDGVLLVRMHDADGKLWNVEQINPHDFSKRGLQGGRRKGLYCCIGSLADSLVICEGFATGASIHEATKLPVAVAFNSGNLLPVAIALREKYPTLRIILAADDDWRTDGNPGKTQATAAAQAVDGLIAVPRFSADRPDKATDFNDLHTMIGVAAVRQCFDEPMHASGEENWPLPAPLPAALPPVEAFDAELLPAALHPWIMDIAHRMQCPPDFPAAAALVGLSSLIGARAVLRPKARDDWQVVPTLWGACVGRPGVKKSPALTEALKPLYRLQAAEHERWEALSDAWIVDSKLFELAQADREKKAKCLAGKDPAQARALLQVRDDIEPEPVERRFIVNDSTVEKLGELLAANPWGTLSYRDELYGLLTGMDRVGQEGARAFYLQAFDGNEGYTFDRIGRGTVHIPRVCLAMIGGIQPGRIQDYVRGAVAGGRGDDGLLQRFGLTVWPDIDADYVHVDEWPDKAAREEAWAVFERLAQLQPGDDEAPAVWRFSPEAQVIFDRWLMEFEPELRRDDVHPALVSHLAKYRKLIPALALIFAMLDTPHSGGIVGERELERALAWSVYLRSHAERLYSAAVVPESAGARTLLAKIKAGKLADADGVLLECFSARQVAQKCWAGLGSPEAVRNAADLLVEWDYLRRESVPTGTAGGRPTERYRINPRVLGGRR